MLWGGLGDSANYPLSFYFMEHYSYYLKKQKPKKFRSKTFQLALKNLRRRLKKYSNDNDD
jgi:hypothetical protein